MQGVRFRRLVIPRLQGYGFKGCCLVSRFKVIGLSLGILVLGPGVRLMRLGTSQF